jgi:hypothetical protein
VNDTHSHSAAPTVPAIKVEKRSIMFNGRDTSITLRPALYDAFQRLVKRRGSNIKATVASWKLNNANQIVPTIEAYVTEHNDGPVYDYAAREQWLTAVVDAFRPIFAARGYPLPEHVKVSIGFPSTGWRGKRRGECWDPSMSLKGWTEIFINPVIGDVTEIVSILTHELCHAAVGTEFGHGKRFINAGLALDLEGPAKSMDGGERWREWAGPIIQAVGPMPHAALKAFERKPKVQTSRMIKVECPECKAITRMSRKVIEQVVQNAPDEDVAELRCVDPMCLGTIAAYPLLAGAQAGEGDDAGEDEGEPQRKPVDFRRAK